MFKRITIVPSTESNNSTKLKQDKSITKNLKTIRNTVLNRKISLKKLQNMKIKNNFYFQIDSA